MNIKNLSTSIFYEDIIITNLTGYITTTDVDTWFNSFEKACYPFISQEKKFKLFVNRKGYTPEHFSVQKLWKDKFFSNNILDNTIAIAFLLEEGDILNHLQNSNSKENVLFSSNYEQLFDWLSTFRQ
ncbi:MULTISPECIES: STAS/SEC14 domain-containing protein [unclassified Psychrobacillus]|uniref:STAS/SEC14 domain-containing protein n=1 Tax=unclassified Psychrobacillus TaxID=2636677 RepID=UPI0012B00DAF|nr:STAS/SEC14 domain-containing protein [Bacillus sp. N3536]